MRLNKFLSGLAAVLLAFSLHTLIKGFRILQWINITHLQVISKKITIIIKIIY